MDEQVKELLKVYRVLNRAFKVIQDSDYLSKECSDIEHQLGNAYEMLSEKLEQQDYYGHIKL